MALCSEACASASAVESSSSEAGSSCLHFGVRSYLHHFYEECSSSMFDKDPEDRGFGRRSAKWWNSFVWKVSLLLGLLILTAGVATLLVGFSTPHKIESFGEGELFFVDAQAVSFNRGLHVSATTGIGLSCLGCALTAMAVVVWLLPRVDLKKRLCKRQGEDEPKWRGSRDEENVVTKPPGKEEGKVPFALAKVENVQPISKN